MPADIASFSDIVDFCDLKIDGLRKWIKVPNVVPGAQTFSNIFAIIETDLFKRCLSGHIDDCTKLVLICTPCHGAPT